MPDTTFERQPCDRAPSVDLLAWLDQKPRRFDPSTLTPGESKPVAWLVFDEIRPARAFKLDGKLVVESDSYRDEDPDPSTLFEASDLLRAIWQRLDDAFKPDLTTVQK